jgi:hypothetical protein
MQVSFQYIHPISSFFPRAPSSHCQTARPYHRSPNRFVDHRPISPTVLDTLKPRELVAVSCSFFFSVCILCIIGALGPSVSAPSVSTRSAPCSAVTPCAGATAPVISYAFGALDQFNQATWLTAVMRRPLDIYGAPIAPSKPFSFYLSWTVLSATNNGAPLAAATNASRSAQVFCPPAQTECSPVFLFGRVLYGPSEFALDVRFEDPLAAFRGEPALGNRGVSFEFRQGTVDARYTRFEVATKVFFCTVSMCIWAFYLFCLVRRDPATTLSPTQLWAAALGGLVFWFSDPLFLTYLVRPSLESAAFSAFCTGTFVALLLFFFLCLADNARLEAEMGVRWRVDGSARLMGALYWVPKVLLCGVVWALSVSLYVFQRLSQLEDPTFTFSDSFGATAVLWASRFAVAIGAIYLVYFVVLLVFAFRRFSALSPSSRYLLAMSVAAIIVTMVGLFSQSFSALRSTAILFLVAQGGPTLYVWNLLLVLRPSPLSPEWTADTTGALGGSEQGGEWGVVIRDAEEDAVAVPLSKEVRALYFATPLPLFVRLMTPLALPLTHHPTPPPPLPSPATLLSPPFRSGPSARQRSSGSWLVRCSLG